MNALGIDYGEARIGVAGSDALGMLAHPLETVDARRAGALQRIAAIAEQRGAEVLVVGMPYRLDGSRGPAAEGVEAFADRLRAAVPGRRVVTWDERLSTVTAQAKLHAAGRDIRRSRAVIDQAAAVEILQCWLDAQAGPQIGHDG